MRFRKGVHYEHPPRGPARKPYTMSPDALRQRRDNLKRTRIRSDRETAIIKRLVWQAPFESGPARSQRALARELSVWHSYVHEVQRQAHSVGMEALANGRRVTLDDLAAAQRFTAKLREQEPGLLAPAASCSLDESEPEPAQIPIPQPPPDPPTYVIPERYRDLEKWKEQYYAERPWLRGLRN